MQKLTYSQKKIAHHPITGQSIIKGEEQAGKTTIGIARMLYLLENTGKKLLFVAIKSEAYEVAKQQLATVKSMENMSLFESDSHLNQGTIYRLEDLLAQLAQECFKEKPYIYIEEIPEMLLEEAIHQVKKEYPRVKCLKEKRLLKEEMKWMDVKGYTSLEDYLDADRVGCEMKWPKKGKTRQALWALKTYIEVELEEQGKMTTSQRDLRLLIALKESRLKGQYVHLIVDDAHLLTEVQLELLGLLRKEQKGEVLFLVAIKPEFSRMLGLTRGTSYKKLGYDMTGRVRRLKGMRQKGKVKAKKQISLEPTPLEIFMTNQLNNHQASHLPWYVETYKYINKLTGLETIFKQDTSAGETYIDEVKQEDVQSLPIYSDIAAGMPIEVVDDTCGSFEIPGELTGHKKNTYMLHVQGDSMIGAGIDDGDYVVIQAGSVSDHEIAAIYYNGAITLKRIVQEEEHILLVSENPKYRPIVIEDGEFRAMGKLIGVIKNL